ncbi:uncharacterized protein PV06_11670 [Exophiala oligosperma]|uniref:Reverse transcriptase zinc-binding domain-containing protein n=1 Tax=Exophiala oligosperma TaxID=215243 RepID=A0A0D2CYC9_9EURO|nr:uncharacterized protein PV06_11670 [Exophiala oligosperma]KIW36038.1 hypothetical protein PV06_11670 [Exophiala oligosperma]
MKRQFFLHVPTSFFVVALVSRLRITSDIGLSAPPPAGYAQGLIGGVWTTRYAHVLHGNASTKSQWATRVEENEDWLLDVSCAESIGCTRLKLHCTGYQDVFRSFDLSQQPSAIRAHKPDRTAASVDCQLSTFQGSDKERQLFEYFRTRVVFQLSGFLDEDFWITTVLKVSHSVSSVHRLAIAIAAYIGEHDRHSRTTMPQQSWNASLKYYQTALCKANRYTESVDQELVAILSCPLFLCMEFLQGKKLQAMSLFLHGYLLMRTFQEQNSRNSAISRWAVVYESLGPVYNRLMMMSKLFGHSFPTDYSNLAFLPGSNPTPSSTFNNLTVVAKPRQQSGQWIVRRIYELLGRLAASWKPRVVFQWIPSESATRGSELAHDLARRAAHPNRQIPVGTKLKSTARRKPKGTHDEQRKQFEARPGGRYTKQLDRALPGKHTRKLYDNLKRDEAQTLAQLRTGKSRLNRALYRIKAVDSDQCEWCRRPETVRHFLTECTRWTLQRQQYLHATTERWMDVSFLLGGWTNERVDGPLKK